MAASRATSPQPSGDRDEHDRLIAEAEQAEREHGATGRTLFDLRMIIGGMFLFYGVYLTVRGIADGHTAIAQAAGVRINLWTGMAALVAGAGFVAWALLRPLTLEQMVEGQAGSLESDLEHDALAEERDTSGRFRH